MKTGKDSVSVGSNLDSINDTHRGEPHEILSGVNPWRVATLSLGIFVIVLLGLLISSMRTLNMLNSTPTFSPKYPLATIPPELLIKEEVIYAGTIRTGAQIGKGYCADGIYLVSSDSTYQIGKNGSVLLEYPKPSQTPDLLKFKQYIGQKVQVVGTYPVQESRCEALICDCEDYMTVRSITPIAPITPIPKVSGQITIEGTIDCLPKKGNQQTLECAIGLKSVDGKYYALTNLNQDDLESGKLSGGTHVIITGNRTGDFGGTYDIAGTIEVVSLRTSP